MKQVKPPLKIRVRSYDKILTRDLDTHEYLFALDNGVVNEFGELYLDHWIGEASKEYAERYLR